MSLMNELLPTSFGMMEQTLIWLRKVGRVPDMEKLLYLKGFRKSHFQNKKTAIRGWKSVL